MSRKPCLYDQVTLDDGSEGEIKFIGSLSGKDDLYYGVNLTVLGKHKYNNIDGTIRNIKYFDTTNGKNGRLCKKKTIKYYKLTGNSIKLTYGNKIYIENAYCDGIIKYIGIPPDQTTEYIGVELEEENGDCDGTYKPNGAQYFQCGKNYGMYVPLPSMDSIQSSKGNATQNDDKKVGDKASYAQNAEVKMDEDGNKTYTTGTAKNKVVTTVYAVNSGIESGNTGGSVKDRMSLWNKKSANDKQHAQKAQKEKQIRTSMKLNDKAMAIKMQKEKEETDKIRLEQEKKAEQIKRDKLERQRLRKEENEKQKREQKQKLEKEKSEKAAAEKAKKEQLERETREREAAERVRKEQEEKRKREAAEKRRKEKLEKEKREKEAAEKATKEKLEREKREREAAEKERKEKLERQKREKEAAENARKEKLEREKQQREAAENEEKEKEKERIRKGTLAKKEKERRDREAKEKAEKLEREKREREEKERKLKELEIQKEKLRKEKIEKERIEKEKREREEKERKEREAKERIRKQKEAFERKEKERKEREERERQQKLEKEKRLKASRERAEKIRKEKEEKAKKEREEKLKAQKEKEKKEREQKLKREQEAKAKAEQEAKAKASQSSAVDSGSIYNNDEQYDSDDDAKNAAEMRRKQEEEEEAELARQIMARKKRKAEEEKKKALQNKSNNNSNTKKKGGNDAELMDMMSQMNAWKNKNNTNSNASQFKRKGKQKDSGLKGIKGRKFSNAPKAKKNYSKKDLEIELKQSIGKDIHKITMVKLDKYEGDIPLILYLLGNEMYKLNKFGTFKLFEPEEMQSKKGSDSVCNLAWNIYLFFAQLPSPLLDTVPQDILMKAINKDVMKDVIHAMDEPFASTLVYLWDILARVAMESKGSKMGQQQLGKVFGPMTTMVTQEDAKGNRVSMNVLAASRMIAMCRRGIEWRMQVAGFDFHDSSDDDSD